MADNHDTRALPPALPQKVEPVVFVNRANAFEPTRTYRIEDGELRVESEAPKKAGGRQEVARVYALGSIVSVHLRFRPTRSQRNRYECWIRFGTGQGLAVLNESYLGFARFQDQSAGYRDFVRALCAAVAERNPEAEFRCGSSMTKLVLEWGFLGVALAALALVLWVSGGALRGLAVLKLGISVFFGPTLWRYALGNRPGSFDPRAVQDRVLPAD